LLPSLSQTFDDLGTVFCLYQLWELIFLEIKVKLHFSSCFRLFELESRIFDFREDLWIIEFCTLILHGISVSVVEPEMMRPEVSMHNEAHRSVLPSDEREEAYVSCFVRIILV
jgi:hypothetical protein